MAKPTIVIVPGCWHIPAHFASLQNSLESAGYKVIGIDLPANNFPTATMDDDLSAIRTTVLSELDAGNDVVVVCHSYGSLPGTGAMNNLCTKSRSAAGNKTSVKGIVIIAGFLLPTGSTMLGVMGGQLAPQYLHDQTSDTTLPFNGPGATFILYNDCDPTEAEKAIHKLRPQAFAVNTTKTPDQIAALQGIPISYLACSNDNAVPLDHQKGIVAGYKAAAIEVYAEVAPTGHSPFLVKPEETAKFVRKAAGEQGLESGFEVLES